MVARSERDRRSKKARPCRVETRSTHVSAGPFQGSPFWSGDADLAKARLGRRVEGLDRLGRGAVLPQVGALVGVLAQIVELVPGAVGDRQLEVAVDERPARVVVGPGGHVDEDV